MDVPFDDQVINDNEDSENDEFSDENEELYESDSNIDNGNS